jgi:thiol-disulfide isomerase/thioredoxin
MKKLFFALAIALVGLSACDKVENPTPESSSNGGLDWSLYPDGDSSHYVNVANAWPTFAPNTNTNRNVLLEDFTGHKCIYCPAAADSAHQIESDYPGRVMVSSIHTGPSGLEAFQAPEAVPSIFSTDLTCSEGIEIGLTFGNNWPGSPFVGNPYGTVSRKDNGNGFPVTIANQWRSATSSILTMNDLKVNIQAANNYYSSTRGLFLHTEVDVIDLNLTNDLKIVVHLLENSVIGAQAYPASVIDSFYVHKDVFRGSIDGFNFGRTLDAAHLNSNGKYYFDYSYELPLQYDPNNIHLLIYVRDAVTEEVYQVIKQTL